MTCFAQLVRPDGSIVYIAPAQVVDICEPLQADMPAALQHADRSDYAKVYMINKFHVVQGSVAAVASVVDQCR